MRIITCVLFLRGGALSRSFVCFVSATQALDSEDGCRRFTRSLGAGVPWQILDNGAELSRSASDDTIVWPGGTVSHNRKRRVAMHSIHVGALTGGDALFINLSSTLFRTLPSFFPPSFSLSHSLSLSLSLSIPLSLRVPARAYTHRLANNMASSCSDYS